VADESHAGETLGKASSNCADFEGGWGSAFEGVRRLTEARDPGGLGGLFRIRDQQGSDQPT
jgi:hypothetical protein